MPRPHGPLVLRKTYDNQKYGDALQLLINRMAFSEQKYGPIETNYPIPHHAWQQIIRRLELYHTTGNREWLLDVANFALIEFLRPSLPQAFFEATGSEESPGLI